MAKQRLKDARKLYKQQLEQRKLNDAEYRQAERKRKAASAAEARELKRMIIASEKDGTPLPPYVRLGGKCRLVFIL